MFILTKLPPNVSWMHALRFRQSSIKDFYIQIGLDIPYSPAFSPSSLPITLCNLVYERCGVLFNLAALYSKLASAEDRSNSEGLKRASKNYQASWDIPRLNRCMVSCRSECCWNPILFGFYRSSETQGFLA